MRETGGEIQENRGFNLKKIVQRAASLALVTTAISIPMANEASADFDLNTKPVSNIETKGEMPSQNTETSLMSRDEVSKRVKDVNIEAPSVPREVVMQLMEKYDQDRLGKYYQELKEYGCIDPDRLEACARWLDCFDRYDFRIREDYREANVAINNYELLGSFIDRNDILNFSITGEGLNYYSNSEGKPRFLLCVASEKPTGKAYEKGVAKVTKNFNSAMESLIQIGSDEVIETMWKNGFNTFFAMKFSEGDVTMAKLHEPGVIIGNFDSSVSLKDTLLTRNLTWVIPLETLGIGMLRLDEGAGLDVNIGHVEIIKGMLAGDNWEYLYKVSEEKNVYSSKFSRYARGTFDTFFYTHRLSPQDPYLKKIYEEIVKGGLLKPIGAENWQEVEALVEETPESRPWLK